MHSVQRVRRWLASGLVGCLLFMQWASAAHACQGPVPAQPDRAAKASSMPDCNGDMTGADAGPTQLCELHCTSDGQSLNTLGALPVLPPVDTRCAIAGLVAVDRAAERSALPLPAAWLGPPPGAPPLYLCLLVLRN